MTRVLLATNGSGFQIDRCLDLPAFRESIAALVSDRRCPALEVAARHGVESIDLDERDHGRLNARILDLATAREIDYIISPGFTRIFGGSLLERFRHRIFNCHPSLLPAFRGFYDTRDTTRTHPARKIFERILEFGSRVTGNTIHVVTEQVDEGRPIIVSTMNIPYDEDPALTRHRLFVQECQCLLQVVAWLRQGRVTVDGSGRPRVAGARFDAPHFSPNLDDEAVIAFDLDYPF